MKKILVFGFTNNIGGIETFYMNYYRNLNKKKYQIDFITVYDNMAFQKEVISNDSKVYKLPNFKTHPIKYTKKLKQILKNNNYNSVHVNMLSAANILPLKIAKRCGVSQIIAHSHNNGMPSGIIRKVMHNVNKKKIKKYANCLLACSEDAGQWLFGKNSGFIVLNNAIDIDRFSYNEKYRKALRKQLKIGNEFLVGHVGRFCEQKNQIFLIKLFSQYLKYDKLAKLILIGDGEEKENIQKLIEKLNIKNNVIIINNTPDVYKYYSVFDLFIFPSKFEGLGIVALEAQASGLKCIFSENIIKDVDLNNNSYLKLSNIEDWVAEMLNWSKGYKREVLYERFVENGFDIKHEVRKIERCYDGECDEERK